MPAKPQRLNRIYIRRRDIAMSLYRRNKELCFRSEDVMRLHWDRQGPRAREWARTMIKRMRNDGVVVSLHADPTNKRVMLYRFTDQALRGWHLA